MTGGFFTPSPGGQYMIDGRSHRKLRRREVRAIYAEYVLRAQLQRRGGCGSDQLGRILGYPPCCVVDFRTAPAVRPGPFHGSGYRPCDRCAERPVREVIREINQRRTASWSFRLPIGGGR